MTINTQSNKTIVLGNGSQTQFAFGFVGVAAVYISVILTDASGNETVLGQGSGASQYQIALNTPVAGALWGIGGTVTYDPSGTPIPTGSSLTIFRTLPLTQAISLQNLISLSTLGNGAETGLDTLEMQLQQIQETFGRAIVAPVVDPDTINLTLPAAAQRANLVLGFDGAGNVIAASTPSSGVISSAMQPVVNAASLAAGRTAFGLGNVAVEGIGAGLQDNGAGLLEVNSQLTSIATNQSVNASFAQNTYVVTGPVNFTLARANTLWNGFSFSGFVLGGGLLLIPDTNDSIEGQVSGVSVAIPANSSFVITTDGATSGNWRVTVTAAAFGAVRGLTVANNASTPNTKIDVTCADLVMVNSTGYGAKASAVAFTIDLTTGTSTSAANGLDGEAIPANGYVFLWAISNGNTTAGLASTSSTAPTMPAGYTFKKYLGAMRTASSILMRTRQLGRDTQYQITTGSNTTVPPVIVTGSTATAWTALPVVGSFVPSTASKIKLIVNALLTNVNQLALAPNNNYPTTNNGSQPSSPVSYICESGFAFGVGIVAELELESTNIYWGANATSASISALGWTDNNI